MIPDSTVSHLCGWIMDGGHFEIASSVPQMIRLQGLLKAEPSGPILLYRAWHDALGNYPSYIAQQIGDCVSFGHAHANDLLQCIEICFGEPSEFRETDTEFIYGESRKVAGILSNQDGSYGSAAVKAMLNSGIVSREMLGSDGAYSGRRAKAWGLNGPPAEVEKQAAAFKLGSVSNVTTWEELVAALWNGLPVTICTGMGFTMSRDNQGFCTPSGRWGHCMFVSGVRFDRKGACVVQSWGPNVPDGPTDLDQPDFSFWVDKTAIEKILSEGDSWALCKSPDFVKRRLPRSWTV